MDSVRDKHRRQNEAFIDQQLGANGSISPIYGNYTAFQSGRFFSGKDPHSGQNSSINRDSSYLQPSSVGDRDSIGSLVLTFGLLGSFGFAAYSGINSGIGPALKTCFFGSVSSIAIWFSINKSESSTLPANDDFPTLNKEQLPYQKTLSRKIAISSCVTFIKNELINHIDKGTLQDYLENVGMPKLQIVEDLMCGHRSVHCSQKSQNDPDSQIPELIAEIRCHLESGRLEQALKIDSDVMEEIRSQWHELLIDIPEKTKAQIIIEETESRLRWQKLKNIVVDTASFVLNCTVAFGAASLSFQVRDVTVATLPNQQKSPAPISTPLHPVTPKATPTHYVTTQSSPLNVRKNPSTDEPIIGKISKGSCTTVIGSTKNAWAQVAFSVQGEVKQGYTSTQFLKPIPNGYRCP